MFKGGCREYELVEKDLQLRRGEFKSCRYYLCDLGQVISSL